MLAAPAPNSRLRGGVGAGVLLLCGFVASVELAEAAPIVTPGCVLEGVTSRLRGAAGGLEALFCAVFGLVDCGVVSLVSIDCGVAAFFTVGPAEVLRPWNTVLRMTTIAAAWTAMRVPRAGRSARAGSGCGLSSRGMPRPCPLFSDKANRLGCQGSGPHSNWS